MSFVMLRYAAAFFLLGSVRFHSWVPTVGISNFATYCIQLITSLFEPLPRYISTNPLNALRPSRLLNTNFVLHLPSALQSPLFPPSPPSPPARPSNLAHLNISYFLLLPLLSLSLNKTLNLFFPSRDTNRSLAVHLCRDPERHLVRASALEVARPRSDVGSNSSYSLEETTSYTGDETPQTAIFSTRVSGPIPPSPSPSSLLTSRELAPPSRQSKQSLHDPSNILGSISGLTGSTSGLSTLPSPLENSPTVGVQSKSVCHFLHVAHVACKQGTSYVVLCFRIPCTLFLGPP